MKIYNINEISKTTVLNAKVIVTNGTKNEKSVFNNLDEVAEHYFRWKEYCCITAENDLISKGIHVFADPYCENDLMVLSMC